jgi:hypothetical protein
MRAILYDKTCDCPSSELARRALTQARVDFESLSTQTRSTVMARSGSLAARGASS